MRRSMNANFHTVLYFAAMKVAAFHSHAAELVCCAATDVLSRHSYHYLLHPRTLAIRSALQITARSLQHETRDVSPAIVHL
jgi:hypothetical protein